MLMQKPSRLDKALANVCLNCPVCRRARGQQRGTAFWLVRKIEGRVCPFCRAYERVFDRKAHERRALTPEPPS
jgi:rubrerythrin